MSCSLTAFGQSKATREKNTSPAADNHRGSGADDEIDSKLCVKLAPLALLDPYNGMAVRVGVEYKLGGSLACYHEAGTYIPNANSMSNNTGILLRTELKNYFNHSRRSSGGYISAELFYKYQAYGTTDSIRSTPNYSKDYHVFKSVGCFTVKCGYMKVYRFRLILEGFAGLGIRYKLTHSTLSATENDNLMSSDDSYNINLIRNTAGTRIMLNVDIGLKIGFRIK